MYYMHIRNTTEYWPLLISLITFPHAMSVWVENALTNFQVKEPLTNKYPSIKPLFINMYRLSKNKFVLMFEMTSDLHKYLIETDMCVCIQHVYLSNCINFSVGYQRSRFFLQKICNPASLGRFFSPTRSSLIVINRCWWFILFSLPVLHWRVR